MRDEGVIKFRCTWISRHPIYPHRIQEMIEVRNDLYAKGLIGVYPDGIGYGNVSVRINYAGRFVISGSQTGHVKKADASHFTMVTGYDIEGNAVVCEGPVQASSESLTHAVVYEAFPIAGAVIHVHDAQLWRKRLGQIPTTRREVPYGTPEMAREILRLAAQSNLGRERMAVMAGHEAGIMIFGRNLAAAYQRLAREAGCCRRDPL